jgi:RNA polymerase-binding transcription factor DksA
MDQQTQNEFKSKLEARKKEVMEQLGTIGTRTEGEKGAEVNFDANFPQYGDSMEDNAEEVADYIKNLSVEKDLEKELRATDAALKRIEAGTYGLCSHCGQPIEIERLNIRPSSASCVACKNKLKSNI